MTGKDLSIIISHVRQYEQSDATTYELQSMKDHTLGVANLAKRFAQKITAHTPLGEVGYLLGLLHDMGKYQEAFQRYIKYASGIAGDSPTASTPHSAVGAYVAYEKLANHWLQKIVANCVAGHHRGLYDDGALLDRIDNNHQTDKQFQHAKSGAKDEGASLKEAIVASLTKSSKIMPTSICVEDVPLLTRMLYSCLIDADFLDTEQFMSPTRSLQREQGFDSLHTLKEKYERYIERFAADTPINAARTAFSEQCKAHGLEASDGIYSLFLPTGAGKTLASMRWALENAISKGKDRIIYVIPYTSIITQTADIFRTIFGESNVLEHHSDIDTSDEEVYNITKLLSENWNAPIIITTNVQFFESLYSNRVGRCRKLHNICNSVVVFDEVQMFPSGLLNPMLRTIKSLNRFCQTQVLLCTATLPLFDEEVNRTGKEDKSFYKLTDRIEEVVPYEEEHFRVFDKVDYQLDILEETYASLAKRLKEHESFLCIVNSRKDAMQLYRELSTIYQGDDLFHLSRLMCSVHIKEVLEEVIKRRKAGMPVKLISTQLVEAGVDLDFPVVYRAKAGLDSIVQAGGRCNREGKLEKGEVFVFNLTDGGQPFGDIKLGAYATDEILAKHKDTEWKVYHTPIIRDYYRSFYSRVPSFDAKEIQDCFWTRSRLRGLRFDFETAAERFRYIDDSTIRIVVPYKEAGRLLVSKIIGRMPLSREDFRLMKKLEVGLYERDLGKLLHQGSVETIEWQNQTVWLMTDSSGYCSKTGVLMKNHYIEEELIT